MKRNRFKEFLKCFCLFILGAAFFTVSVIIVIQDIKHTSRSENREITRRIIPARSEYEHVDKNMIVTELIRLIKSDHIAVKDSINREERTYFWMYGNDRDNAYIQPVMITGEWIDVGKRETFARQELWPKRPSTEIDLIRLRTIMKNKIVFKIESIDRGFWKGLMIMFGYLISAIIGFLFSRWFWSLHSSFYRSVFVVDPESLTISPAMVRRYLMRGRRYYTVTMPNEKKMVVSNEEFTSDQEKNKYYACFKRKAKAKKFVLKEKEKRAKRDT